MKISVCMATYNGEKYIVEQLQSIIPQLNSNDEIIISDDGSKDKTINLIKSFNDSRIKIYYNPCEKGYTSNFENALRHASGDIIFLSDQDDVWLPNKIEIMCKSLEDNDLVVSDVKIVDSNLKVLNDSHFKVFGVKPGFIVNFLFTRYIGASMAFNKKVLLKVLPFPKNKKRCAHDYWIAMIGEFFYKVELVTIPTMLYRRHDANASTGGEKSRNSIKDKIFNRIYVFLKLLIRLKR